MRKFIIICMLLLFSFPAFATGFEKEVSKKESPLMEYKPIYFIAGDDGDQVKAQVSMKYAMFYPFNVGLYVGYSQVMFWRLYDKSSPFEDVNYNPELFYELQSKNNFWKYDLKIIDYIRVGIWEHKSNGQQGWKNRSWNRGYVQAGISYGNKVNVGTDLKIFKMYTISNDNKDIQEYIGSYEHETFIQFKSRSKYFTKERIYIKHGPGGDGVKSTNPFHGWIETGIRSRIVTSRIQFYLYAQLYHGYAESLLKYNKKETAFRVGVTL